MQFASSYELSFRARGTTLVAPGETVGKEETEKEDELGHSCENGTHPSTGVDSDV